MVKILRVKGKERLREKLKSFISYDEGVNIREILFKSAMKKYIPQHKFEEYFKFMNNHECTFKIVHPQSQNNPWYFCLFTEISQHVHGDCVEECMDNAMQYLSSPKKVGDGFKVGIIKLMKGIEEEVITTKENKG